MMPPPSDWLTATAGGVAEDTGKFSPSPRPIQIAIIENRALFRECLWKGFEAAQQNVSVHLFYTIRDWQAVAAQSTTVSLVVVSLSGDRINEIAAEIEALVQRSKIPVVVMSDGENADMIDKALDVGVRGIIPASIGLHLAIEAMRFVAAGGTYLPNSYVLLAGRGSEDASEDRNAASEQFFTYREAEVLEALRQGAPNKIIAYKLGMKEGTVKVHIRNIMRKLNAKNRTEVAYIANTLSKNPRKNGG